MTKFLLLLLLTQTIVACVPTAITGGSYTGVQLAQDRREATAIENDKEIQEALTKEITRSEDLNHNSHITVVSFNEKVLLIGQVPNQTMKTELGQLANQTPNVKKVYNELTVGPVTGLTQRTTDAWLTTRVKTAIIGNNTLGSLMIDVFTENGTVYLMGFVTQSEGELAVEKARSVKGVKEVVKLFEYVD
jgi:osmotically-inducible protein OsmY